MAGIAPDGLVLGDVAFLTADASWNKAHDVKYAGLKSHRAPILNAMVPINQQYLMRRILVVLLAVLTIVGQSRMAFVQHPIAKGEWTYKNGRPESVTFDYGTELTAGEIDRLSHCTSSARIVMGYAGIDCEYVEIEGDLVELGHLMNLKDVHLNNKLKNLEERAVSSPIPRKRDDPKEISRLPGTWEYVSATYEGKPIDLGKHETITLTEDDWTLRRSGKLISSSTWEIDSTRSLKWLTQFTRGGNVSFLDRWVYKFDEEQLVLCKSRGWTSVDQRNSYLKKATNNT